MIRKSLRHLSALNQIKNGESGCFVAPLSDENICERFPRFKKMLLVSMNYSTNFSNIRRTKYQQFNQEMRCHKRLKLLRATMKYRQITVNTSLPVIVGPNFRCLFCCDVI